MEPRLDQFLHTLSHHRVALAGLAVAVTLGSMVGGFLKPSDMLQQPMAAQLISSTQAPAAPPEVFETFPANASNRPWVAGTDSTKISELPRLNAAYSDSADLELIDQTMPDTTPSVADHAVDAVAEVPAADGPAA